MLHLAKTLINNQRVCSLSPIGKSTWFVACGREQVNITQLYTDVTNRIIAELEAGVIPWTKPWKAQPGVHTGIMPQNFATGRAYHGINIPIL